MDLSWEIELGSRKMFEMKSTDDLIRIAAAGGGFEIKAGLRSTNDLIRIAAAASNHKSRLVFRGCGLKATDDLIRIAAAGKGAVMFGDD